MSGHYTRLNWCKQKHCLTQKLNREIKSWMFDAGSLTARLINYCDGRFSVKVLSVKRATPTPDEKEALGLSARSHALIREVLLFCNDEPVVYARTIIPVSSLRGALRGLALLGNRPLGAVLFSDKSMQRKPVEVTSVKASHKCYQWMQQQKSEKLGKEKIYGRRSVFVLKGEELLVSEFFLPSLLVESTNQG